MWTEFPSSMNDILLGPTTYGYTPVPFSQAHGPLHIPMPLRFFVPIRVQLHVFLDLEDCSHIGGLVLLATRH